MQETKIAQNFPRFKFISNENIEISIKVELNKNRKEFHFTSSLEKRQRLYLIGAKLRVCFQQSLVILPKLSMSTKRCDSSKLSKNTSFFYFSPFRRN